MCSTNFSTKSLPRFTFYCIMNMSISKCAVYMLSRRYMCVYLFDICCLAITFYLHLIHIFSILLIKWLWDAFTVCVWHQWNLEMILTIFKFQLFLFFTRHINFDVTTDVAVLIVLVSFWGSSRKTCMLFYVLYSKSQATLESSWLLYNVCFDHLLSWISWLAS